MMFKQLKNLHFSVPCQLFRKLSFCGLLLASQTLAANETLSRQLLGRDPIHPVILAVLWLFVLNAAAGGYDLVLHFRNARGSRRETTFESESPLMQASSPTEG